MKTIRQPAVAGLFYPEDSDDLSTMVDAYLAEAKVPKAMPKALIAPHAGYQYSGPVAGSAFAALHSLASRITRVVLLGPSHQVSFSGLAMSRASGFETPLGLIPLDAEAEDCLHGIPQVVHLEAAHTMEHSLEVELPFLQRCLPTFTLLPLVVGSASYRDVSEVLEAVWGGEETLIVVSSDLSHYLDYYRAKKVDDATRLLIEDLRSDALSPQRACGYIPIAGLLCSARNRGMRVTTLDMRNSGDTAGSQDRVVGYGAFAFE